MFVKKTKTGFDMSFVSWFQLVFVQEGKQGRDCCDSSGLCHTDISVFRYILFSESKNKAEMFVSVCLDGRVEPGSGPVVLLVNR